MFDYYEEFLAEGIDKHTRSLRVAIGSIASRFLGGTDSTENFWEPLSGSIYAASIALACRLKPTLLLSLVSSNSDSLISSCRAHSEAFTTARSRATFKQKTPQALAFIAS
ncbi:hypothetical protein [Pseudovibrio ascidiaceicola]|uniref:hypothetical protein n=1 Tax=Pseudovibrio ascidiaceicola TaxID=285279 RepID=UPI000B835667|nr:hypothetical protein [Pseudovibrio ascidiaceicola]